ncbi:uncharacterized protein LOC125494881 [Beta vulgaris subsp. vulgaris]|uniref:uncharacterized protein LOC125494881 n=1 Tax=Beta vulgaris subsp. vulgaris TaxID=3555 RepID=UPI002037584A|nr:uncharacterized protein LOC125494881 [Beta vulgaris subsp. vulgaris]
MEDRIGAPIRSNECMEFRRCVDNCQMDDMKATGCFYTWNNKQSGEARVFSKIDRVMCNVEWILAYQFNEAMFHPEGDFDHSPMVLISHPGIQSGKKPFRYFAMWKNAANFETIVQSSWNEMIVGTPMFRVTQKLKRVKIKLKQLNKEGFSDLQAKEIATAESLRECQTLLHQFPEDLELRRKESQVAQEHRVAHDSYMAFLQQKAKCAWLKDGDANTKVFHRHIKKRQIKNAVFGIHNERGEWVSQPDQINQAFLDYYQSLLGTTMPDRRKVKRNIVAA